MSCSSITPTDGVEVALRCPAAATQSEPLPVDLSGVVGAELVANVAWKLPGGARLQLSCARLPTALWLDGLEGAVLSGASALARKTAGLTSLQAGEVDAVASRFQQRFEGDAHGRRARGHHIFAFVDDGALLCTSVCVGDDCQPDMSITGTLQPAPQPSWLMQSVEHAAAHPRVAAGSMGALLIAAVALLLARRPRPRW